MAYQGPARLDAILCRPRDRVSEERMCDSSQRFTCKTYSSALVFVPPIFICWGQARMITICASMLARETFRVVIVLGRADARQDSAGLRKAEAFSAKHRWLKNFSVQVMQGYCRDAPHHAACESGPSTRIPGIQLLTVSRNLLGCSCRLLLDAAAPACATHPSSGSCTAVRYPGRNVCSHDGACYRPVSSFYDHMCRDQ